MIVALASANPTAITTACIALGGSLVGAGLSTGTQLLLARSQRKRDDGMRQRQLKIAARMMVVDLSRARSNIQYCVDYQEWWRTDGLKARMGPDDRRLVIGALTSQQFYDVDLAEGSIDHWYSTRDYELSLHPGSYTSDAIPMQVEKLEEMVGWLEAAVAALRPLTGDPESLENEPADAPEDAEET